MTNWPKFFQILTMHRTGPGFRAEMPLERVVDEPDNKLATILCMCPVPEGEAFGITREAIEWMQENGKVKS